MMLEATYLSETRKKLIEKEKAKELKKIEKNEPHYRFEAAKRAVLVGIDFEEFVRRDNIVRAMARDVFFYPDQMLYPSTLANEEKYGACKYVGHYKTYFDYTVDEAKAWKKDDRPLICTIHTTKTDEVLCCTPNWLQRESNIKQVKCD